MKFRTKNEKEKETAIPQCLSHSACNSHVEHCNRALIISLDCTLPQSATVIQIEVMTIIGDLVNSGGSRIWVTGGGGWNSKTPKLVIATRSRRGPALAPSRGSGGMLPREILKIGMRRYAFFTILGYNFRKIRERICKVICTYIYNFYKIFEVTGKIRKIKKKMFNMK